MLFTQGSQIFRYIGSENMGCSRDRTQQSLKREGSAARSNPLPFYIPFLTENESIPSIDKWYPFHIPILELCFPYNCCKCSFFKIWINHKTITFSPFLSVMKWICLFTERIADFPTLSYNILRSSFTSLLVKSVLHLHQGQKRYPFRAEPPSRGYSEGALSSRGRGCRGMHPIFLLA